MPFGEIEGHPIGSRFASRRALQQAGLHRHLQAGISGSGVAGADAIVLSGGYEDDEDFGDVIVYTGQGGNDAGRQVADQKFTRGNLALAVDQAQGYPVRVIMGFGHDSKWSPKDGYEYSGLYVVDKHWRTRGKTGFLVHRYQLVRNNPGLPIIREAGLELPQPQAPGGAQGPERAEVVGARIIRDTRVTRWVKEIHDYCCQVCGVRLEVPAGPRAEGAHIRPLGRPHNGPDVPENVLCLCPNHHLLFDEGGFAIADDYNLLGIAGTLRRDRRHELSLEQVRYHREHFWTAD